MKRTDLAPYTVQQVRRTPLLYGWRDTPAMMAVQDKTIELLDEHGRNEALNTLLRAMYPSPAGSTN